MLCTSLSIHLVPWLNFTAILEYKPLEQQVCVSVRFHRKWRFQLFAYYFHSSTCSHVTYVEITSKFNIVRPVTSRKEFNKAELSFKIPYDLNLRSSGILHKLEFRSVFISSKSAWLLNVWATGCPKVSVYKRQSKLRSCPPERRSHKRVAEPELSHQQVSLQV